MRVMVEAKTDALCAEYVNRIVDFIKEKDYNILCERLFPLGSLFTFPGKCREMSEIEWKHSGKCEKSM